MDGDTRALRTTIEDLENEVRELNDELATAKEQLISRQQAYDELYTKMDQIDTIARSAI